MRIRNSYSIIPNSHIPNYFPPSFELPTPVEALPLARALSLSTASQSVMASLSVSSNTSFTISFREIIQDFDGRWYNDELIGGYK